MESPAFRHGEDVKLNKLKEQIDIPDDCVSFWIEWKIRPSNKQYCVGEWTNETGTSRFEISEKYKSDELYNSLNRDFVMPERAECVFLRAVKDESITFESQGQIWPRY